MVFTLQQAKKQLCGLDQALQMAIYHKQNGRETESKTYLAEYLDTIRLMKDKMDLSSNNIVINETQCSLQESRNDTTLITASDDNK